MAQQFNLTAQINLQSPKNVGRVVSDIQRQLKGSGLNTVNIKVKADPRSMAQTNRQLQNVSKNSRAAAKDIGTLNRNLQEATRRFSVITLATGGLLSFVTGFKNATKAAIEFERELVKISQVTGKSVQQLQGLTKEVTRLSTAFGVSSADLLNVSRTLAQAGFNAEKTRKSLDILAKTTLAATFDNIQDTTEGAIALLRQFGDEAKRTGGDVAFLEKSLSAINSVSKKFAVESGDLITVIRRVGGVFSSAGGSINELIALFTSVRATTRESAETIATGLRTIFTRIQRVETINQLKALNIQLQDSQGQFVGAFEAVKRLSQGLSALNPRDFRFNQIVEQLGGFRQIGKVIPLIQQFATAQQALNVAQGASGSVAKDAQTAQQSLAIQIQKVREEFSALIRRFTDSGPFNSIATGALKIASAMIKVTEAVEPLLPLLITMFGLKLGRALAPGLGRLAGIGRSGAGGGGGFSRFNRGGMVPGSGNRDTVPAMLTPGEFVIRKSSVEKLGADRLQQMNNNRFKGGNNKKGVTKDQGKDKKRGRFRLLPSKGQTHFSHLDKMGEPSRNFQSLLSKKDPNIKARAVYSNFGIDIPGTWNMDWGQQRGGTFLRDNEGATKSALASFVKDRDIFKSLKERKKPYKFRGEGSEEAQSIIQDKKKMKKVRKSFANKIRLSSIDNFDVDPDVIRADVGGMLLQSFRDVPGVKSTKVIPFFKQASAYRLEGDSRRRSVSGVGLEEGGLEAASETRRRRVLPSRDLTDSDRTARLNTLRIQEYVKDLESETGNKLTSQQLLGPPHFEKLRKKLGGFRGDDGDAKLKRVILAPRFANGGQVRGIQKFSKGGSPKKNAYIFDFDDTLATTEAKSFKDFSNPDFIESASATRYASLAKRRAAQGDDVHVLTARSGSKAIRGAIASFMAKNGIATKSIMGVGKAFPNEREPGKRPGTTRKLSTASKKQKVLENLAKRYGQITFLDDNIENILQASKVKNVRAVTAEKEKLFKNFEVGGKVGVFDSDMIQDKTQAAAIRQSIIDSKKLKKLIWGPAGSGKTTYAKDMYGDNFVKSMDHLAEYDDFIVLSGAQTTKKSTKVGEKDVNLSQTTVDLIREAKEITAIIPEQQLLISRREKRIANPESVRSMGDLRSEGSLKATLKLAGESQANEILKTFQTLKSGISVLRPTMANPSGKTIEATAGAVASAGGRILGTTSKTKDLTLEEAVAAGLKRSTLTPAYGKDAVDAFFGGTAAENQAAKRKAEGVSRKRKGATDSNLTYGAAFLEKVTSSTSGERSVDVDGKKILYDFKTAYVDASDAKKIKDDYVVPQAKKAVQSIASLFANSVGATAQKSDNIPNLPAITGSLYEAGLARVIGGGIADDADDNRIFDFPSGLKDAAGIFGADGKALQNVKTDAKVASSSSALKSIRAKVKNDLSKNKFAKGGAAPSDTVPALLTPGEFVFSADSAKKIGYANLNRMNKQGVQGYAAGGVVGNLRQRVSEKASNARASVASSLAVIDPIAQSAQNFVFLGTSVAAVTSQLSGMEDATKKALNESLAFGTGIVGILATVVSSFSALTRSKTSETVATDSNTNATVENTAAKKVNTNKNNASTATVGKGTVAMVGFTAGMLVTTTVMKFFEARARATAEKFDKAADESLKALGEGKFRNVNDIKTAQRRNIDQTLDAESFKPGIEGRRQIVNTAATGVGLVSGLVAGAKIGAAAGSFGGPAGAIIGAGIGAGVGGLAGFGTGVATNKVIDAVAQEEKKAREANIQAIEKSIDAFVELSNVQRELANVEKQIAAAPGLSDEQKISRRLGAVRRAGSSDASFQEATSGVNEILSEVGRELGKSAQNIQEDDIKLFDKSGATLLKYKRLQEQAAKAQEVLNTKLSMTASALDLATQGLDGTKSFEELINGSSLFAKAFRERRKAVEEAGKREIQEAKDRVEAARRATYLTTNSQEEQVAATRRLIQAEEEEKRITDQVNQRNKDLVTSTENIVDTIEERHNAEVRAKEAQIAVDIAMKKLVKTSETLDAALLSVADQAKAVDRFVAVLENRTSKIEASRVDEIDDVTAIGDINKFAKQVREVSAKGGAATAQIGESLISNAVLMKKAGDALLGFDPTKLGENADFAEQIRKATGLNELTIPGGKAVFSQIVENLSKIGKRVGQEDISSILAPLAKISQEQANQIVKLINLEQNNINLYQQKLDALDAVRAKELEIREAQIDALQRSADLNVRAANLLAKSIDPNALGIDPGIIQQKLADQAAQMSLDDLDLGLQAGNTRQIARFRKQAQNNLLKLSQDENVTAKQRMSMERRFIRIIDVTGKELERLGDQSGKAGILMGEMEKNISAIEKERAAREQITGVIEEFVIGGPEERGNLVSAANGIRQAFATGTLQMQTPDQRKATVGLLDRLGDVKLFGNITGKEIKKQLIFKDAIRLGLPPQLADAIANGTTAEEKLIQANKDLANQIQLLTMQMFMATMAMQANAGQRDLQAVRPTRKLTAADFDEALGAAKGGPIYKNTGGTIFKPRGTDTVPAMLTPGEFVIRKSSVDQIGAGNLAALNNGDAAVVRSKGGPIYRAGGGPVNYLNNGGQGKLSEEENRQFLMGSLGLGNISRPDFDRYMRLDQQAIEGAIMEGSRAHRTVQGIQTGLRAASVFVPPASALSGILGVTTANTLGDPSGYYARSSSLDFGTSVIPGGFGTAAVGRALTKGITGVGRGVKNLGKSMAAGPKPSRVSEMMMQFDDALLSGSPKPSPGANIDLLNPYPTGASSPRNTQLSYSFNRPASRLTNNQFNFQMGQGLAGGGSRNQALTQKALTEGLDTVNLGTKAGAYADEVARLNDDFARAIPSAAEEQTIRRTISNRIADASEANRGFTGRGGQSLGDPISNAVRAKAREILGVKLPETAGRAKTGFVQGMEDMFIHAGGAALKNTSQAKKDLLKFLASPAARSMGDAGLRSLVEIYKSMPGVGTVTSESNQEIEDELERQRKKGIILRSEEDAFLARIEKDEPGRISKTKKQIKQFGSPLSQQGGDALLRQRNFQFMMENVVDENSESVTRGGYLGYGGETGIQKTIASGKKVARGDRSVINRNATVGDEYAFAERRRPNSDPKAPLKSRGPAARSNELDAKIDTSRVAANAEVDDERILQGILLRREQERVEERAKRANTASSLAKKSKRGGEKFAAQQKEAKRKKDFNSLMDRAAEARDAGTARIKANAAATTARSDQLDRDIEAGKKAREAAKKEEQKIQKSGGPMGVRTFIDRYNKEYGDELADLFKDDPRMAQELITAKYEDYRQALREGVTNYRTTGPEDTNLTYRKKFNEQVGIPTEIYSGPVYRAFGGGIGYGRGGYGAGNTGRMQAARGNQFMMQRFQQGNQFMNKRYQQGMGFMNNMRNEAISYNLSRPGFQNFAGGTGLRARKPPTLYPFKAGGEQERNVDIEQFNRILRTQGPKPALRFAFGKQIPQGAYIGPRAVAQQQQEELTPEQMNQRMMQMMMQQLQRMEARQAQQNRNAGGVRPLQRAAGGGPIYRAGGGGVPGGDTVPAMLTPGEFVMNAGAVRQHGIGTMRALNRGQVPGFNRGGMVGGVQYRQNGGLMGMIGGAAQALGIDTKEISSTFDNFVGNFSGVLDNITTAFSPITSAIQNLANIFGGSEGIKMTHNHTVTIAAGEAKKANLTEDDKKDIAMAVYDYAKNKSPNPNDFKGLA